jgi:hypothetical protein
MACLKSKNWKDEKGSLSLSLYSVPQCLPYATAVGRCIYHCVYSFGLRAIDPVLGQTYSNSIGVRQEGAVWFFSWYAPVDFYNCGFNLTTAWGHMKLPKLCCTYLVFFSSNWSQHMHQKILCHHDSKRWSMSCCIRNKFMCIFAENWTCPWFILCVVVLQCKYYTSLSVGFKIASLQQSMC